MCGWIALVLSLASSPLELDYVSRGGLNVKIGDVPLVMGSFFQVYEPGWSKGYYSSNWNEQTVEKAGGGYNIAARSTDKRVLADISVQSTEFGFRVQYEFEWRGEKEAHLELSLGHLWAPALADGQLEIDSIPAKPLGKVVAQGQDPQLRAFGPKGKVFRFIAPAANVQVNVDSPLPVDIFDARGYQSDWSSQNELFWLGVSNVSLMPNQKTKIVADWMIDSKLDAPQTEPVMKIASDWKRDSAVFGPYEGPLPIVPKPKQLEKKDAPAFSWGANLSGLPLAQRTALQGRWTGITGSGGKVVLTQQNLGLKRGGYKLISQKGKLEVVAADADGFSNGLWRAVTLTRPEKGRLVIPAMTLTDEPAIDWRGIHLFVGPEALGFQGNLMQRVLAPMMLNQIVLQAERTNWEATRGTEAGWTMKKEDLAKLVGFYRAHGIEPTPLIQSFGHMGWLFMNGQNRDLMFNPEVPFSIDPRVPRSQELLRKLWKEVVAMFQPKIMHFGLDEVDMRGWPSGNYDLVTELWKKQVEFLGQLANENGAGMMVWGDKLLAPGEAPDATHGHTKAHAAERRSALPPGSFIADWHYKNDANPKIYTSLNLFKKEGFQPIASTWFRPNNIKGFFRAAAEADAGVLQTTWAGYESNEPNMVREFDQLVSYVLAGDYAWSNRDELPDKLPYRPDELLRRLYSSQSIPVKPVGGWTSGSKTEMIGAFKLGMVQPIGLRFALKEDRKAAPTNLTFSVGHSVSKVALGLSVVNRVSPMKRVGTVRLKYAGGKVKEFGISYGRDLRSASDAKSALKSAAKNGVFAVEFPADEKSRLESVEMEVNDVTVGLTYHGSALVAGSTQK